MDMNETLPYCAWSSAAWKACPMSQRHLEFQGRGPYPSVIECQEGPRPKGRMLPYLIPSDRPDAYHLHPRNRSDILSSPFRPPNRYDPVTVFLLGFPCEASHAVKLANPGNLAVYSCWFHAGIGVGSGAPR